MVFKNGAFYQLATPEGRAVYQSGVWSYEYFHTDHLGNTRVAYKANGTALTKTSETSFDPWGIVLRDAGLVNTFQNRFEYQNKEKESTFNLRRIDFGARSYNASIGRFDRIDPLAEKRAWLTPYNYVQNNPLNRFDPNGAIDAPCCGGNPTDALLSEAKAQWEAIKSNTKNFLRQVESGIANVLSFTDFNDATVLVTTATRGKNAINIDGSKATTADKWAAAGGAVLPVISGSAAKKVVGAVVDKIDDALKIDVADANKINRELLDPPAKHGNAPTFKKDGTSVEIHHEGQKREGPFKEMHWEDHRGKGNDAINHPNKSQPSQVDRKEFDKAKREYWKQQYPKQ